MFDKALQEIAGRIPGFLGAVLVGMDGIPLARVARGRGPDLDACSAEFATLLRRIGSMPSQEGAGRLHGLLTLGENWNLVVERVTDDYFLLLAAAPDGPVGRCRYELRRAALDLAGDLT